MITIAAADRQAPAFTRVLVSDSKAWTLRGLHVRGEGVDYLVRLDGNNEDVRVEDCVLMSTADASSWSAQDWIDRASSGIRVAGTRITIRNNYLQIDQPTNRPLRAEGVEDDRQVQKHAWFETYVRSATHAGRRPTPCTTSVLGSGPDALSRILQARAPPRAAVLENRG